ncbi:MAG: hypothetical protein O3A01_04780 [bacterium]|nr:hypothetical protein [bacterium]
MNKTKNLLNAVLYRRLAAPSPESDLDGFEIIGLADFLLKVEPGQEVAVMLGAVNSGDRLQLRNWLMGLDLDAALTDARLAEENFALPIKDQGYDLQVVILALLARVRAAALSLFSGESSGADAAERESGFVPVSSAFPEIESALDTLSQLQARGISLKLLLAELVLRSGQAGDRLVQSHAIVPVDAEVNMAELRAAMRDATNDQYLLPKCKELVVLHHSIAMAVAGFGDDLLAQLTDSILSDAGLPCEHDSGYQGEQLPLFELLKWSSVVERLEQSEGSFSDVLLDNLLSGTETGSCLGMLASQQKWDLVLRILNQAQKKEPVARVSLNTVSHILGRVPLVIATQIVNAFLPCISDGTAKILLENVLGRPDMEPWRSVTTLLSKKACLTPSELARLFITRLQGDDDKAWIGPILSAVNPNVTLGNCAGLVPFVMAELTSGIAPSDCCLPEVSADIRAGFVNALVASPDPFSFKGWVQEQVLSKNLDVLHALVKQWPELGRFFAQFPVPMSQLIEEKNDGILLFCLQQQAQFSGEFQLTKDDLLALARATKNFSPFAPAVEPLISQEVAAQVCNELILSDTIGDSMNKAGLLFEKAGRSLDGVFPAIQERIKSNPLWVERLGIHFDSPVTAEQLASVVLQEGVVVRDAIKVLGGLLPKEFTPADAPHIAQIVVKMVSEGASLSDATALFGADKTVREAIANALITHAADGFLPYFKGAIESVGKIAVTDLLDVFPALKDWVLEYPPQHQLGCVFTWGKSKADLVKYLVQQGIDVTAGNGDYAPIVHMAADSVIKGQSGGLLGYIGQHSRFQRQVLGVVATKGAKAGEETVFSRLAAARKFDAIKAVMGHADKPFSEIPSGDAVAMGINAPLGDEVSVLHMCVARASDAEQGGAYKELARWLVKSGADKHVVKSIIFPGESTPVSLKPQEIIHQAYPKSVSEQWKGVFG